MGPSQEKCTTRYYLLQKQHYLESLTQILKIIKLEV